jgi:hypothetical protein
VRLTTPNGVFEQRFDGKNGWRIFANRVNELSGAELAAVAENASLSTPLSLGRGLDGAKVLADEAVANGTKRVPTHVIEGKRGRATERFWFDAESGLLVKSAKRTPTPLGDLLEETSYEDYRMVDGVRDSFSRRQSSGGEERRESFSEMVHNLPVDDKIFARPAQSAGPAN